MQNPSKQFEYHEERVSFLDFSTESIQEFLNRWGSQGWELVSHKADGTSETHIFIFKRELILEKID